MDRGAWQATVHKAAKIRTQLKQRSMHVYLDSPAGSSIDKGQINKEKSKISIAMCSHALALSNE